uniref:Glycosyl hydrolases family 16 n=1 Tax=Candidatus Kentrum sp. FW TaxID=2126338 RepID=A0A450TIL5_9GAMM|nr:MAG: Glycosyl hydrolases family 16 [Candidatus Kentron sp. FW]
MKKSKSIVFPIIYFTLASCIIIGMVFSSSSRGLESNSDTGYAAGEIYSNETFPAGRFEVRMKVCNIEGTVSSMFLYKNDSWQVGNMWNEIDIEFLGKNISQFQSNIISGYAPEMSEDHHPVSPDASQNFHTYAIEWTPDYIAWFLDGMEVRRAEPSKNNQLSHFKDNRMSVRFNLWPVADYPEIQKWAGTLNDDDLTAYAFYDWFQYWEYTPGRGSNNSDFTLKWRDDFEKFDPSRWGKADWTFSGNKATFNKRNIGYKDGHLILCITKGNTTGCTI